MREELEDLMDDYESEKEEKYAFLSSFTLDRLICEASSFDDLRELYLHSNTNNDVRLKSAIQVRMRDDANSFEKAKALYTFLKVCPNYKENIFSRKIKNRLLNFAKSFNNLLTVCLVGSIYDDMDLLGRAQNELFNSVSSFETGLSLYNHIVHLQQNLQEKSFAVRVGVYLFENAHCLDDLRKLYGIARTRSSEEFLAKVRGSLLDKSKSFDDFRLLYSDVTFYKDSIFLEDVSVNWLNGTDSFEELKDLYCLSKIHEDESLADKASKKLLNIADLAGWDLLEDVYRTARMYHDGLFSNDLGSVLVNKAQTESDCESLYLTAKHYEDILLLEGVKNKWFEIAKSSQDLKTLHFWVVNDDSKFAARVKKKLYVVSSLNEIASICYSPSFSGYPTTWRDVFAKVKFYADAFVSAFFP